jgi:hypothetical protein
MPIEQPGPDRHMPQPQLYDYSMVKSAGLFGRVNY